MLKNILFEVRQPLLLNVQTMLQQLSNKTSSFSVSALKKKKQKKKQQHLKQRKNILIASPLIGSIAEASVRPELQDLTHAQHR